jgi:hypothetical protein
MVEDFKIGDLYLRDYDAELYLVKSVHKKKLLELNSPLEIKFDCQTKDHSAKIILRNGLIEGVTERDSNWYKIENIEDISKIELPFDTEITIKIRNHRDCFLYISSNKMCYLRNEGTTERRLLNGTDINRVKRLIYIKYWELINN